MSVKPTLQQMLFMCRYNQLLKQKTDLEELERELKSEREKIISENKSHQDTDAQYRKLKEEHDT